MLRTTFLLGVCIWVVAAYYSPILAQKIEKVEELQTSGKIRSIKPGQIIVQQPDGKLLACKIQNKNEQALALDGGKYILPLPADIKVSGKLSASLIEPGMILQCTARINKRGQTDPPVNLLKVIDLEPHDLRVQFGDELKLDEFTECQLSGRVINLTNNRLTLYVQKSRASPKERITVEIDPGGTLEITGDNLNRVLVGDEVKSMKVVKLSNGDQIVKEIEIEFTAKREKATASYEDLLEQKYSKHSDEPREARMVKSDHFVLYTDISDRSAAILLEKLERMYTLVGRYFGKRPRKPIECYVVSDLSKFSNLDPDGVQSIANGAGVTVSAKLVERSDGDIVDVMATVYSCDTHGVVQHESVHAFCNLTFGSAGPVWFAEGMAEMGQYWKPDELAVSIDPVVIDYLTNSEKKKLTDIVSEGQITGDSWQAYAWRWAICHLLANHPTHGNTFRRLGLEMMSGNENASFKSAFGGVARQLSFEYDQFIRNFGNGYRVDLCAWDWTTKADTLSVAGRAKSEVKAQRGWQATGVQLEKGLSYDFVSQGTWTIRKDSPSTDANGDDSGDGQLVGAIFSGSALGFELSDEFDLGAKGSFVAQGDGQLFVRCREDWTELGDNDGALTVFFRRTPAEKN